MSAVYRATDPNLRRMVAIKLIHPHLSSSPAFVNRFKEEAAAIARLRHPNIVQVHDFNVDGDTYYMVMEYLTGESLQSHISRLKKSNRYMTYERVIEVCQQICQALDYAHRHELIHRDVKPANIMLDIHGHAILMDFGIVKIVGGEYHTATGATLGTVKYMSPEQMRNEKVDERSDIYSLGVTLYEMISGQVPYLADSVPTLMMMTLNDPLPDLRQMRKQIPDELVKVVEKALAKDAAKRYQSMDQMAQDLARAYQTVEHAAPEATVVDEDQSSPEQPGKAQLPQEHDASPETKSKGRKTSRRRSRPGPSEIEPQISDLPTAIDPHEAPSTPPRRAKPSKPKPEIQKTTHKKLIIGLAIVLTLATIITAGLFYSRRLPAIEISPVIQSEVVINAQTADYIVSLGRWTTGSTLSDLEYSPHGGFLGTANNRDRERLSPYRYYGAIWDPIDGSLQRYQTDHAQWVTSVSFTPDGNSFTSASDDGMIILQDISNPGEARVFSNTTGGVTAIAISSSNTLLASGSDEGMVDLWSLSGSWLRTLEGHAAGIRDISFNQDGSLLASGSDDSTITIWRVNDGEVMHRFEHHSAPVRAVAFSNNGRWLASASEDQTICLWDLDDGSLHKVLPDHNDPVTALEFSLDSSLLVSGSDNGTILLWQVPEGILIRTLEETTETIIGIEFSPEGDLLVVGTWDGQLLFWGTSVALPANVSTPTPET
jgi:serine/threonine protein kinase